MNESYLKPGLAIPVPQPDGLDKPYWDGLAEDRLLLQKCKGCNRFQWGPEWICHRCHSFDIEYQQVEGRGRIYSYQRCWHPVHSALKDQGPYIIVLVELPEADNVRIVGNLLGDPEQTVTIGAEVEAVFEHHPDTNPPYTLLHWKCTE